MKSDVNIILKNFSYFILKCVLPAVVLGLIYLDIKTFGNIREQSFVEIGQSVFLLAASLILCSWLTKRKQMVCG